MKYIDKFRKSARAVVPVRVRKPVVAVPGTRRHVHAIVESAAEEREEAPLTSAGSLYLSVLFLPLLHGGRFPPCSPLKWLSFQRARAAAPVRVRKPAVAGPGTRRHAHARVESAAEERPLAVFIFPAICSFICSASSSS